METFVIENFCNPEGCGAMLVEGCKFDKKEWKDRAGRLLAMNFGEVLVERFGETSELMDKLP